MRERGRNWRKCKEEGKRTKGRGGNNLSECNRWEGLRERGRK